MERAPPITLRALTAIDDLRRCEAVQRAVWGFGDLEVMAASHLSAAVHAGGLVAGAFHRGTLCGFVYGFPAHERGSAGLHSHMMAVLSEYRGLGIGQQLKWFQRNWCVQRGLNWVTWTFDPLQAKNAKLNLEHLGGTASEYLVNPYGILGGELNGALPSDRLTVRWSLLHAEVARLESRVTRAPLARASFQAAPHMYALHADALEPNVTGGALLYVATPEDINALRSADTEKALVWRLAQREVFLKLFRRGYTVTRFVEAHYVLEKAEEGMT